MYISNVVIKNFRNFKDFSIKLHPFVTVIGENNIGKSNLLEAIYLVLSHDISAYRKRKLDIEDINFEAVVEFKDDVLNKKLDEIEFPKVQIDLYFQEPNLNQETIIDDCWVDVRQKIAKVSYVYSFKSNKKSEVLKQLKEIVAVCKEKGMESEEIRNFIDFPIDYYEYKIVCGSEDKVADPYWLKMMKMEYLDALRDAKRELNSNSDNKLLYRILADRDHDEFSRIKEQMIELDRIVKEDGNVLESLKDDISAYLDRISLATETSSNRVAFEFGSIELPEVLKKIGIQYGDDAVSIERNGLGRNNLLYMAVVLAHLYEKKENLYRLIAIEEPEAHLCPTLQRHLSKNLYDDQKEESQQVIITTHSTHIASYLDLDSTVVMFKEKGCVSSHYLLDKFSSNAEDQKSIRYLQKWLNATNSTMFYSRKLIFVEGIAEEILIPVFYEYLYKKSLDKVNCQVINVNGVAFRNFLKVVMNGYFIKTAVLTDSDKGKNTENRASKLKQDYDSEVIKICITSESTFEKELIHTNEKTQASKRIILDILQEVRPNKCNKEFYESQLSEFDVNKIFDCIEDYKAEFAFELANKLTAAKSSTSKIKVPQYIQDAFKFIME